MAPRPDLLTDRGRALLAELPVVLREDPDYIALMHVTARSLDEKERRLEWTRDQANPLTADARGLGWWEALLRLPRPDAADPVEVRRERVVDRYRSLTGDPSTADWVDRVSRAINSPWRWEQYVPIARRAINLVPNGRGLAGVSTAVGWGPLSATLAQLPGGGVRYTTTATTLAGAYYASASAASLARDAPVEPGVPYTMTVRVLAMPPGVTVRPMFIFRDASGANIAGTSKNAPDLTAPGDSSVTSTPPAGAVSGAMTAYRIPGGAAAVGDVVDLAGWAMRRGTIAPDVADGDSTGWEWLGTPRQSSSRKLSPVAQQTIRVFLPTDPASPLWEIQTAAIREETPSEITLIFASTQGFRLDVSKMDQDAMTI